MTRVDEDAILYKIIQLPAGHLNIKNTEYQRYQGEYLVWHRQRKAVRGEAGRAERKAAGAAELIRIEEQVNRWTWQSEMKFF